jgi:hypothetical protein
MSEGNKILRSNDVAHILDCTPDEVVELARRGKIKGEKQGHFWLFQERDVTDYARKQKRKNSA